MCADPYDAENHDGFLRALGLKRVTPAERFVADHLNAEQGSDTSDEPESRADQLSSTLFGQQNFVDRGFLPGIALGSDQSVPLSAPPIRLLDPNTVNPVSPSGWSATFHYADTDTKKVLLPLPKVQLSGRGRLGLTPTSNESLDVYLPVMLYPRTTLVKDNEWHSDGLFFGALCGRRGIVPIGTCRRPHASSVYCGYSGPENRREFLRFRRRAIFQA